MKIFSPKDRSVISSDNTTQALVKMWDENVLTFMVEPSLSNEIKVDDVVLVEFIAPSPNSQPRQTIIKILRDETAVFTWKKYIDHYEKRKKEFKEKDRHTGYTG